MTTRIGHSDTARPVEATPLTVGRAPGPSRGPAADPRAKPARTAPSPPGPPSDDDNRALATSAAVMASGTLVSRVLGLLRNALLVAVVGALGSMADAWSVANKLPNIISMLLAGGILNAVLVPQVVRAMRRPDGGEEHVNRLLTVAIAVLLGITVLLTAAASLLITIYAASFPPEWKAVAVALAFWCIPQLFFYGLYTLLGQVLNARSIFGPYMWAPAVNNVVAIAGLVAFLMVFGPLPDGGLAPEAWTSSRITLLAGTATLGVVAQALVLIVPLYRSGFRFRPVWGVRGHGLGRASTVASWAFAALAIGQLGYLAVSNVAAAASAVGVETGQSIAGNLAYDNAFLVFMLPQSLVTVSLVTALFTRVAHNAAARDGARVRDDLSLGLRTLSIFTVFATAALTVLAIPLVQVVTLDRAPGGFADYRAIGAVLVAMAFGLVSIAVWTMVQRVFYAYEDTRTLFQIQVPMAVMLALGCVLSWWLLEPQWWVVGAGAATTVSNTVGATVGYLATRKYLPNLDGARVLRTHLRVLLAAVPVALVGWGVLHLWGVQTGFLGALARVVVLGAAMTASYLALVRLLRVSELDGLAARVRGPLGRVMRLVRPGGGGDGPPSTMSGSEGGKGRGEGVVTTDFSVTLRAGELVADRFRLDRPLDVDVPDGSAWAGTDTKLSTEVRVLLVQGPERDHTIDAARRAALIEDPRLPRVLRAGVEAGHGYVVTEPVAGVTLAELLRGGPLPPSQARALVGEAAVALEVARRRGVHHLALRPSVLVRTDDAEVRVTGLGFDAAWRGLELREGRAAARRDAVGLVHLLYAALTGTWPGPESLADGLPLAPRPGGVLTPAGDLVESVPNDLDTLCAVTMGEHDDGPFTPGELVADLAPWGAIDVTAPAAPLPPVVRPGEAAPVLPVVDGDEAGMGSEPGAITPDPAPWALTAGETAALAPTAGAEPAGEAPAPPVRQSIMDTSTWAPHPLPALSEPTPFAELVSDTGTIPALPARHQRTRELRAVVTAVRAAAAPAPVTEEPTEQATQEASREETASAAVEQEEASREEASREEAVSAAVEQEEATATAVSTAVDETTVAAPAAQPAPAQLAVGGLPMLTREPRGWDVPGGPGPSLLPEPEPEPDHVTPSPAMRTGTEATARTTGLAAAVAAGAAGARSASPSKLAEVGAEARQLLGGVGARIGAVVHRSSEFVEEVRDEFRPVEEETEDGRARFNPAPIALAVMLAVVIFGLVLSVMTLRDAATSFTPGPNPGEAPPSATASEDPSAQEPTAEPTTEPAETDGPPPASAVPIAEGVTFDPTVAGGENQDSAYLAFDGNPDTTWNSLRYNSPTYGMKSGLGFTVVLDQAALVSSVTLDVRGEGGLVEIRVGNAGAPNSGEVLASGAMGHDVTYTFAEPVEAESISLWFPELPVADSDGRNRIELAEIRLG